MNKNDQHLNYIAPVLRVGDLSRSLEFYCGRLGFIVEFVYESFYASVRRDGARIHLKLSREKLPDQSSFAESEHIDANIGVQDAEALAKSFGGVPFVVPLRQMPYGIEFYVRDPDGYVLGFVQPASQ